MIVKTIFVIKHAFGPFEVDSIGPVSETTNDIRFRISQGRLMFQPVVPDIFQLQARGRSSLIRTERNLS